MLAVRRTSVTEAAMALQDAGLITHRRGTIQLLNIEGLENTSCECLQRIRSVADDLLGKSRDPTFPLTAGRTNEPWWTIFYV